MLFAVLKAKKIPANKYLRKIEKSFGKRNHRRTAPRQTAKRFCRLSRSCFPWKQDSAACSENHVLTNPKNAYRNNAFGMRFLFAIFLKNYLTNRKTYAIIKVLCEFFTVRGVTQLGRVLALGARCRRFESCRLDHIVPNILSNSSAGCFFVLQFFDKNRAIFSFFCYIAGKLLLTKTKRKNHLVLKSSASVFKKQGKSEKSA